MNISGELIKNEAETPLFTLTVFLIPLAILFFLNQCYKPIIINLLIIFLVIFYLTFLILYYICSKRDLKNQGEVLLILLFLLPFLLLITLFVLLDCYSTERISLSDVMSYLVVVLIIFTFSMFLYFHSFPLEKLVVTFLGHFHKFIYNRKYNEETLIEVKEEKEFNLGYNDFSFFSFDCYLQSQFTWALIIFVNFPFSSIDEIIQNPFHNPEVFLFMFIIIFLGFPLGLIQFRNYKKDVTFILKPKNLGQSPTIKAYEEKKLSEDLVKMMELAILISIIVKISKILPTILELGFNIPFLTFIFFYFIISWFFVCIILFYFVQLSLFEIKDHKFYKKNINRDEKILNNIISGLFYFLFESHDKILGKFMQVKRNHQHPLKRFLIDVNIFLVDLVYVIMAFGVFIIFSLILYIHILLKYTLILLVSLFGFFIFVGSFFINLNTYKNQS